VKTLRLVVDPTRLDVEEAKNSIAIAADIIRQGGLVALPTETVYGLGANALDAAAVARIFAAKERPSWDPVIVHIAGPVAENKMLDNLVIEIPDRAQALMQAFWPGPLTLLLPRSRAVPDSITAGRPLVGVRMPAHPVAIELIRQAGVPIAAPSANTFGHTSPTTAEHVLQDLDGKIDAVIDAGATLHGVESTVLDPCQNPMVIYRPGAITSADIRRVSGSVTVFETKETPAPRQPSHAFREALPSPGLGMRHYAPRARLVLIDAPLAELLLKLEDAARTFEKERLGLMLPTELANTELGAPLRAAVRFSWGRLAAPEELAANLYAGLRALDAEECTVILCPFPAGEGISDAVRDRLRKAACSSD
jgi:L-threonylcarbamoyladenylate synthase